jgi:hypothetical protein
VVELSPLAETSQEKDPEIDVFRISTYISSLESRIISISLKLDAFIVVQQGNFWRNPRCQEGIRIPASAPTLAGWWRRKSRV